MMRLTSAGTTSVSPPQGRRFSLLNTLTKEDFVAILDTAHQKRGVDGRTNGLDLGAPRGPGKTHPVQVILNEWALGEICIADQEHLRRLAEDRGYDVPIKWAEALFGAYYPLAINRAPEAVIMAAREGVGRRAGLEGLGGMKDWGISLLPGVGFLNTCFGALASVLSIVSGREDARLK